MEDFLWIKLKILLCLYFYLTANEVTARGIRLLRIIILCMQSKIKLSSLYACLHVRICTSPQEKNIYTSAFQPSHAVLLLYSINNILSV